MISGQLQCFRAGPLLLCGYPQNAKGGKLAEPSNPNLKLQLFHCKFGSSGIVKSTKKEQYTSIGRRLVFLLSVNINRVYISMSTECLRLNSPIHLQQPAGLPNGEKGTGSAPHDLVAYHAGMWISTKGKGRDSESRQNLQSQLETSVR